jgi:glycosyltransferase involved in cell wall biosynthesis
MQADFLLLTSRFEGCPLVVLEAMQCALPVIATRVGGLPELLGPEGSTLLAKPDAVQLSQAIINSAHDYARYSAAMLKQNALFTANALMPLWYRYIDQDCP